MTKRYYYDLHTHSCLSPCADDDNTPSNLVGMAKLAGLDGVVASAKELKAIKSELGDDFIVLTPGIRPTWSAVNDQQRIATPSSAIKDGADFIVLGRAVTCANDKIEAMKKIYEEIQGDK